MIPAIILILREREKHLQYKAETVNWHGSLIFGRKMEML